MNLHLGGDEGQAYSLSHDTTATFSMCSKVFHSSAYITTSNKENLVMPFVLSHSVTAKGCFSPFWITTFAHIHKETLDLSLRRVILNGYDLCLLCWAAFHSFKKHVICSTCMKSGMSLHWSKNHLRDGKRRLVRELLIFYYPCEQSEDHFERLRNVRNYSGCLACSAQSFCS